MYIIVIGLLKKLVICVTYCTNKDLCMKQIRDRSKINLPSKMFITCSIYITNHLALSVLIIVISTQLTVLTPEPDLLSSFSAPAPIWAAAAAVTGTPES